MQKLRSPCLRSRRYSDIKKIRLSPDFFNIYKGSRAAVGREPEETADIADIADFEDTGDTADTADTEAAADREYSKDSSGLGNFLPKKDPHV